MIGSKQRLKKLCDSVYVENVEQILIDLVQNDIEPLLEKDELPTAEKVGAVSYRVDILHEAYNPLLIPGFSILSDIKNAIEDLNDELDANDKLLKNISN